MDEAYDEFKALHADSRHNGEAILKEISHYARQYATFLHGSKKLSKEVNTYLANLRQLKQTTVYLFLFHVFDDLESGVITEKELARVLKLLQNYSIRRIICEITSNSLRGLYKTLYDANILGCTRQFRYSTDSTNTIDMVLSVNGIPVVALELKNQLTGQDVNNAKNQYMHDRSSKEFAFRLNHCFLVYFAVDLCEVWMTTQLQDERTFFMPFNQGSNGAGVTGGAGNPHNPNGYDTAYLWERVLSRDSLMDILHCFVSFVKQKEETVGKDGKPRQAMRERLLFPRFHQSKVLSLHIHTDIPVYDGMERWDAAL